MRRFAINTTTAAAFDGLSLATIKQQLRIRNNDDDSELVKLGQRAVAYVERLSGYYFATRTLTVNLSCFPLGRDAIELPIVPVSSVTSVSYYDTSSADQTWSSDDYTTVLNDMAPSTIQPDYDETWPSAVTGRVDAVRILLVAGHATPSAVPDELQDAALMKLTQLFDRDIENQSNSNDAINRRIASLGWGFYAGAT